MCDYADGNGFGAVSSQNSSVLLTAKDKVLSDQGFNLTELSGSHLQTAQHLRALIAEGSVSDLLIYDGIPKETSQCFTKFRFSVKTPNFNIEKTVDEVSLPFDYIWYYTPVEKAYIEEDIND